MYPKNDYFSFISIETAHDIDGSRRKNNTAANNAASSLSFNCILAISSRILLALDGPNEDESCNRSICAGNVKPWKTRGRSCVAVYCHCELEQWRS